MELYIFTGVQWDKTCEPTYLTALEPGSPTQELCHSGLLFGRAGKKKSKWTYTPPDLPAANTPHPDLSATLTDRICPRPSYLVDAGRQWVSWRKIHPKARFPQSSCVVRPTISCVYVVLHTSSKKRCCCYDNRQKSCYVSVSCLHKQPSVRIKQRLVSTLTCVTVRCNLTSKRECFPGR